MVNTDAKMKTTLQHKFKYKFNEIQCLKIKIKAHLYCSKAICIKQITESLIIKE